MSTMQKEDTVQAVLIADDYDKTLQPFVTSESTSLLPLVNTSLIDYALEALNRSKVEEVFLFATNFVENIKNHIKKRVQEKCTWSIGMTVQVVGSDGCHCLGDALRDLYAKHLLRKHFILLDSNTVTNANLYEILQTHIKRCAFDEGTAMTVIFKKSAPGISSGQEVIIANDARSKRLLFHQRVRSKKSRKCIFPLEIFTEHGSVDIRHNLTDPEIAICAPSVLSLFADNFDFQTRDDFIRGLLINEEILASTIYVSELPSEQYAAKIKDWQSYRMVSHDVINRWVYPLVPDMGICSLQQNYMFLRNNVYRNRTVQMSGNVVSKENVVIHEHCKVDEGTKLIDTVVGKNCRIGKNCTLENAFVFDNVEIGNDCILENCVIGRNNTMLTYFQRSFLSLFLSHTPTTSY